MPKNKMVTKPCPECQQQVPVACKACPCGHVFFTTRRAVGVHKTGGDKARGTGNDEEHSSDVTGSGEGGETKPCRRTERVRRERPNYFGTAATQQQIENRIKSLKRKSKQRTGNSTSSSTNEMEGDASNGEEGNAASHHGHGTSGAPSKKRGRPPKNAAKDKAAEKQAIEKDEKDLLANISAEKSLQLAIVLAEINRKMGAQQFKVPL